MSSEFEATRARKFVRPSVDRHHVTAQEIAHAADEFIGARHVERGRLRFAFHHVHRTGYQQVYAIHLALRTAPADAGPLYGFVGPGAEVLRHAETTHRPPERTEHFPEFYVRGIDLRARYRLVTAKQIFVFAEAAHRQIAASEAPRVRTDPAEIAHRIADVRHFPVEHRNDAVGADHEVAVAEIVVHQRHLRIARQMFLQPATGVVDHRLRRVEQLVALPRLLDERSRVHRVEQRIEPGFLQVDRVDARENLAALERELRTHAC